MNGKKIVDGNKGKAQKRLVRREKEKKLKKKNCLTFDGLA